MFFRKISIKALIIVTCTTGTSLFFGGCPNPVEPPAPVDTPPAVESFMAIPSSAETGQNVKFPFSASDKEGLDSLVLDYGDGATRSFPAARKTFLSDTANYVYKTPGTKNTTLTAYADSKLAAKTFSVSVSQDLPPVIDAVALNCAEGASGAVSLNSFAHDPEGKPVSVSVKTGNPSVNVTLTADSLKFYGLNSDDNGSFPVVFSASDGKKTAEKTVPVVIAIRDDITGKVHDILEGTYIATLSPELVMKGPLAGWATAVTGTESIKIPINSDGTFKFPKVVHGTHRVYRFATNGTDSSFVAYDDFAPGDRTVDGFVHTNAGTDNTGPVIKTLPLKDLQDLYLTGNMETLTGGYLKGMDFTVTNTFYLAGKTITLAGSLYQAMTPAQQDSVENVVNEWKSLLPPDIRSRIVVYKAPQGEAIPQVIDPTSGWPRPPPHMGWVFVENTGGDGSFEYWDQGPVLESALMTFRDAGSFERQHAVQTQELGSWIFAPGQVSVKSLEGKTVFYEGFIPSQPTNADKKLLWLPVQLKLGTPARQYFSLPN